MWRPGRDGFVEFGRFPVTILRPAGLGGRFKSNPANDKVSEPCHIWTSMLGHRMTAVQGRVLCTFELW